MTGNTCEGLGGGYNEYTLIIRGGTVTDNTALESAGGMFNYRSRSFSPCHDAIFVNSAPEGMILDIDNDGTKSIIGGRTGKSEALNACLEMLTLLFAIGIDACLSREQKKLMYIIVAVVFGLIIQDYLDYRMSLYEKLPKLRTFNGITDYVLWQLIYLQVSLSIAE